MFKKAKPTAQRLKFFVYGGTGTGKTITALHFPAPAVIDAEKGTEFYGDKFDFGVEATSDYDDIMKLIDQLTRDPGEFKSLIIDPFTVVYESMIEKHLRKKRVKTGKKDYEMQPLDYRTIKQQTKALINGLLALDMNIIVTCRAKTLYDTNEFMKAIGTTHDGPKELPYLFDTVLELSIDEKGRRIAHVDKDRSGKLPSEFEFTYQKLVEAWGVEGFERAPVAFEAQKRLEERSGRSFETSFEGSAIMTAGITGTQLAEIQALVTKLGLSGEKVKDVLQSDYMVASFRDLKNDEASSFIADLNTAVASV